MLSSSAIPFLPGGRAVRRHRAELQRLLQSEPALRLMPALLDLPLGLDMLPDPASVLAAPRGIALAGPPASGRSLALLQVAARWVAGGVIPALYLPLASLDAPNLSPRAVLAGALHRAGLNPALLEGRRAGVLLCDDWELLAPNRRSIWRSYLSDTAAFWPQTRVVVSLPPGEVWPALARIELRPPDAERAAAWLERLLPGHPVGPLSAALAAGPLATQGYQLCDLLLLALIYPSYGLPASRADLYAQAYALARPLLEPAEAEGASAAPLIGRAALRHYRLARGFAGGSDFAALATLGPGELALVAPLAAGLLGDSGPVVDLLLREAPEAQAALLASAREQRPDPQRSLGLLRQLAQAPAPGADPALPGLIIAAAAAAPAEAIGYARLLLATSAGLLLATLDDPAAPAPLREALAELLLQHPDLAAEPLLPGPGCPPGAAALRAALAAHSPAGRAALASPAFAAARAALLEEPAAAPWRSRAVNQLRAPPATPAPLRAGAPTAADAADELVAETFTSPDPELRKAALASLRRSPSAARMALLRAAALQPELPEPIRADLIAALAELPGPEATVSLSRIVLAPAMPTRARVAAIGGLARRGAAGAAVIQSVASHRDLPPTLRGAALRHLGQAGPTAIPALAAALADRSQPALRRAAALALGELAATPAARDPALAALAAGLARAAPDIDLICAIAAGLGRSGSAPALSLLAALLRPRLEATIAGLWRRAIPALAGGPADSWLDLPLSPALRCALADQVVVGSTLADRPGGLAELAAQGADTIAQAAAAALARLAAARPELGPEVCAALRQALAPARRPAVVRAVLRAMAEVGPPEAELASLLDAPAADLELRWEALESLGGGPAAQALIAQRLREGRDEPLIQSRMLELLDRANAQALEPTLLRLASPPASPQLRAAALAALGRLASPAAVALLLDTLAGPDTPAELCGAAAAALPAELAPGDRQRLRRLARGGDSHPALIYALARAGDREALPGLIRLAQAEQQSATATVIQALVALGDPSATPLLVRICHSPAALPALRLRAALGMVQLEGPRHLPMLRAHLESGALAIQLQAYQGLAAVAPHDQRLWAPLAEIAAPLSLRLLALGYLPEAESQILSTILMNGDEHIQLRLAIVERLAASGDPAAAEALASCLGGDAPPLLRRRSVEALGRLAAAGVDIAAERIAALAADPSQPPEQRHWALLALT